MVTGLWSPSIFFNIALALHSVPNTTILYADKRNERRSANP